MSGYQLRLIRHKVHLKNKQNRYKAIKNSIRLFVAEIWNYYKYKYGTTVYLNLFQKDEVLKECVEILKKYNFSTQQLFIDVDNFGDLPDRSWKTIAKDDVNKEWICIHHTVNELQHYQSQTSSSSSSSASYSTTNILPCKRPFSAVKSTPLYSELASPALKLKKIFHENVLHLSKIMNNLNIFDNFNDPSNLWQANDIKLLKAKSGLCLQKLRDKVCVCGMDFREEMYAIPQCQLQRSEICKEHNGHFHAPLFFDELMKTCKYCQRVLDIQNENLFDPKNAIASHKTNGVITYYDSQNKAWFDDVKKEHHHIEWWVNQYQICRVPRSQSVNLSKVEFNDKKYSVKVVRIENINSGLFIIDDLINTKLERLILKHEKREFNFIHEYNFGNDDCNDDNPKNMERFKQSRAKQTKWYNGIIDYHKADPRYFKTKCGALDQTPGYKTVDYIFNNLVRGILAEIDVKIPKYDGYQIQHYLVSLKNKNRLNAHRDTWRVNWRAFSVLTLGNETSISFVGRNNTQVFKIMKQTRQVIVLIPRCYLATSTKHEMERSDTESLSILGRGGDVCYNDPNKVVPAPRLSSRPTILHEDDLELLFSDDPPGPSSTIFTSKLSSKTFGLPINGNNDTNIEDDNNNDEDIVDQLPSHEYGTRANTKKRLWSCLYE